MSLAGEASQGADQLVLGPRSAWQAHPVKREEQTGGKANGISDTASHERDLRVERDLSVVRTGRLRTGPPRTGPPLGSP